MYYECMFTWYAYYINVLIIFLIHFDPFMRSFYDETKISVKDVCLMSERCFHKSNEKNWIKWNDFEHFFSLMHFKLILNEQIIIHESYVDRIYTLKFIKNVGKVNKFQNSFKWIWRLFYSPVAFQHHEMVPGLKLHAFWMETH